MRTVCAVTVDPFTRRAAMHMCAHSLWRAAYVCFPPRDSIFDPVLIPRGEKPKTARKEQVTKVSTVSHMRVLLVPSQSETQSQQDIASLSTDRTGTI